MRIGRCYLLENQRLRRTLIGNLLIISGLAVRIKNDVPFGHCNSTAGFSLPQAFCNKIDELHDLIDELHFRCSRFLQL